MRLVSYRANGIDSIGIVHGERVLDLPNSADLPNNMVEFLALGQDGMDEARAVLEEASADDGLLLSDVEYLPVVLQPEKVLAVGKNYYAHVSEMQSTPPSHPLLFHKTAGSLTGHNSPIIIPPVTEKVDYEGELVLIIGKTCKNVSSADYLSVIAGFSVGNDVSARDLQRRTSQFTQGKMLDTFGPLGPELVTADEIADPSNLALKTVLNGEVMQDSNTSLLIYDIPYLIEYITSFATLKPGDVIFTGTPGGVGIARDPEVLLKSGDVVTVTIEGVGTLSNTVA